MHVAIKIYSWQEDRIFLRIVLRVDIYENCIKSGYIINMFFKIMQISQNIACPNVMRHTLKVLLSAT